MDTQRLVALAVFIFSSFQLWEAWQRYQHPERYLPKHTTSAPSQPATATVPQPSIAAGTGAAGAPSATAQATAGPVATGRALHGERSVLQSDALRLEFDSHGADLRGAVLNRHRAAQAGDRRFELMGEGEPYFIVQSGLVPQGLPNHNSIFTSEAKAVELKPGASTAELRFDASDTQGAQVVKRYSIRNETSAGGLAGNPYVIDITFDVTNTGQQAISPHAYFQIVRDNVAPPGGQRFVSTYTGPVVYTEKDKFRKVAFGDIDSGKTATPWHTNDGWVGLLQHYFVTAWLPQGQGEREFYLKKLDDKLYSIGVIVPMGKIEPGKTASITMPLYAGPQEVAKLKQLAPGLDLTVDYGWLTVLASPIFWVLQKIHSVVGNWGVAIILLTVLIKLIFFPLSAASYKSMARMKAVAPKLQKLKEQFGDDRQKMSQAMMEMYRTEKINPLGGCLPIAVQIPVFIALYWVLLNAVELRQAPFFGWIKDLSAPDPLYVLPIVMAVSMFVQTKLNPPPPDPVQAKIMLFMPLVFSVFFFFFPAGLVLYWVVNNLWSIAQQWYVMRKYGDAKPAK